jgi:hypothetical protein
MALISHQEPEIGRRDLTVGLCPRDLSRVEYSLEELFRQRVFGLLKDNDFSQQSRLIHQLLCRN